MPCPLAPTEAARPWWSGATEALSEALRWFDDEILVCEGDLVGKTEAQLRSLKFRRDRDFLQS